MVTVIGIDLSLTATGMSDGTSTWLIRSTGHRGDDLAERHERLATITARIEGDVRQWAPQLVVIEAPAFASKTGHMHDRSGLWWLVVHRLRIAGFQVVEVAPTALKKYATGKGNANKGAVIDATARRFPDIDTAADDNRCDALWLAAMGLDHRGQPITDLPAAQRNGLTKVAWPEAAA